MKTITRRDLTVAVIAISTTIAAFALAQPATKPLMQSSVFSWEKLQVKATKTGERRDVFDSPIATADRLECHITTIKPGEAAHAPHQHPEEEFIIIKEGTLECVQNGVTNTAGPGSIVFQSANQLHGMRNIGTTPATYFVLKWFTPASAALAPKKE